MAQINVRGLDPETARRFKVLAALAGSTQAELIERWIAEAWTHRAS